ncbi:hypothetical protein [Bradyrhizobium sp. WD16]|uniref:hypothetical protein n=1 Tax=Bradyrhizobium sp. WD16 TaxID=1521768 RepID=UPI0020A50504|nr:hypothetical protein [Bradyrhizobium sp. WD16]
MDKLDFGGKIILAAGGASGIGNGIAHAFRRKGGQVRVIGPRASPVEHSVDEGSGLDCNQQQSIARWKDAGKSRVQNACKKWPPGRGTAQAADRNNFRSHNR